MKAKSELKAWKAYLQYLKDWADTHTECGFIGMCPVCYDEWLMCEGENYRIEIWGE